MKLKLNLKTVADLSKRALKIGTSLVSGALDYAATIALIAMLSFGCLKLPEIHGQFLRAKVGSKVYMIREKIGGGGGTGFAIKAPSGASYILTNDHVCEVSADKQTVLVSGEDDVNIRRRIIAHDEDSDLCLVEGIPGVEGLSMAKSVPSLGETVNVVGHPRLLPLHLSQGEMIGLESVKIMVGVMSQINPDTNEEFPVPPEVGGITAEQCKLNKYKIEIVTTNTFFGPIKMKLCVSETKDAYITTAIVYGGNSGSPVVNFWGRVEGVVFATDATNYGRIVNLADVKDFLKNY